MIRRERFSTGAAASQLTCVARLRTCCTSSCVSDGFLRNSLTMAVSRVS